MAYVDKTYINFEEYKQTREWWLSTYEQQEKELGSPIWLYTFQVFDFKEVPENFKEFILKNNQDLIEYENVQEFCLWNTSSVQDIWLIKNCSLDFVQLRLKEQYGEDFWAFKYKERLDFEEKPCLISIEYDNNFLYFFKEINEGEIEVFDKMILYGTTLFYKILSDVKKILQHRRIPSEFYQNSKIVFEFYGLKFVVEKNKFKLFIDAVEEEVDFPYIHDIDKIFHFPEIKHSYDIKEAEEYLSEQIIVCDEKECMDITMFKDFDRAHLKRYIHCGVPDYIYNQINLRRVN